MKTVEEIVRHYVCGPCAYMHPRCPDDPDCPTRASVIKTIEVYARDAVGPAMKMLRKHEFHYYVSHRMHFCPECGAKRGNPHAEKCAWNKAIKHTERIMNNGK